MKIQSTRIESWGDICTWIGILVLVIGVVTAFFGAGWGGIGVAALGFGLIIYAPILDGLAVLVRDAEDRICEREKARMAEDDKVVVDWRSKTKE